MLVGETGVQDCLVQGVRRARTKATGGEQATSDLMRDLHALNRTLKERKFVSPQKNSYMV